MGLIYLGVVPVVGTVMAVAGAVIVAYGAGMEAGARASNSAIQNEAKPHQAHPTGLNQLR